MIQFETVLSFNSAGFDVGTNGLVSMSVGSGGFLYSLSSTGGGLAVWRLESGEAPVLHDTHILDATLPVHGDDTLKFLEIAGEDTLVLGVGPAGAMYGYTLDANGAIGSLREFQLPSTTLEGTPVASYSSNGTQLFTVETGDGGQISTFSAGPTGTFNQVATTTGRPSDLQVVEIGSNRLLLSADASSHSVVTYHIDSESEALTKVDNSEAISNLAVNSPSAMEVVRAHGSSWVVLAGAGSNSISVLKLGADGSLAPVDHVLDTNSTKFNSIRDIAIKVVNDHVFLLVGGDDNGISLFALAPGGKLVHLDTFEDTTESRLGSVDTLSIAQVGSELQIFGASQQEGGITHLSVSLNNLGDVVKGDSIQPGTDGHDILRGVGGSTLLAGGGDDILIAGGGTTIMTGGDGADVFVMRSGSRATTVTDFEAGNDRLDLSDYGQLRFPSQLTFVSTDAGAEINFLGDTINLHSLSGEALSKADVFGATFEGPSRLSNGPRDASVEVQTSRGTAGTISINSTEANTGIRDAEIHFNAEGSAPVVAQADDQGQFDLHLPSETVQGHIEIIKSYSTASQEITAQDALETLRMSVGLQPTWGPAQAENFIAADINRDGIVSAKDALDILKVAVGISGNSDAEWVFLDANTDLSETTPNNTRYDTGMSLTTLDGSFSVEMTSILLGNIEQV